MTRRQIINGNASGSSTINYNGIIIDGGASQTWNDYSLDGSTSLALGYGIIYVTVKKTGLKKGQSAIFQLTKQGDSKPYITVILTGKDDSGTAVQRSVALFAGTWTVKETNWSWAYSSDVTEITHSFTKQSDAGTLYEFVNTPRSDTPQHNESIKVNRFRN